MKNNGRFKTVKEKLAQKTVISKIMSVNTEEKIGNNAGEIWNLLNEKGAKSIKEIVKHIKLSEQEIYLSIGWLAREGKLNFEEQSNEIYLSLK